MLGLTDFSLDFLTGYPVLTGLAFLLFLLLSVWLYRRTNPPLPKRLRIILASLRIIAVIALFLALFEPVVSYNRVFERKPKMTLLLDRSGSMNITENETSRAEKADRLIRSPLFKNISDAFDLEIIPFAGSLPIDGKLEDTNKTALGSVLAELSRKQVGEPAEAWMVLSDGISNFGIAPTEVADNIKSPVYTIGIGEDIAARDAAITDIQYNDIIFAGRPTEITIDLEWSGLDNENARLQLKRGNRARESKTVKLGPGELRDQIKMSFTPEKPGRQTFEISLAGIEGESAKSNNSRSFSVNVLKSKLKVLLVAEALDWEYSFLKRFLEKSESVELTEVVYKKGGGTLTGTFPDRQSELNQYDLVIMYDPVWSKLSGKAELADSYLKDNGGGIFILLGQNYLRGSFPRWIDRYLPFLVNRGGRNILYHQFNAVPVENYLFHPGARIGESRSDIRTAWRELPHFETLLPIDSISPGAEILVASDLGEGPEAIPVLGFRRFGPGKLLASSAAPFWHWAFFGYGFGRDQEEYSLFLDGIVNWLALKEETDPVRVYPDKNVYTRGEKIAFNASVYDLGFRPITGVSGYVALIPEDGTDSTVAQFIEIGEGRYRAEIDLIPPGRYSWSGDVEKDGKLLKQSQGQIAVESFTIEEFRRRPDFAALSAVAQATGGEFATIDKADTLLQNLDASTVTIATAYEIPIWDKLWLLMIFIAALGAEWFLRKRNQLI